MAGKLLLSNLKHFKEEAFINGVWKSTSKRFPVFSPATGEEIAHVSDCTEEDVREAITAADKAFLSWKATSCRDRSAMLKDLHAKILADKTELATIMTLECGKPLNESLLEINAAASFMLWFSEEAKRMNGDILPNAESNCRRMVLREPVGVCGLITPWNFPSAMIARKIGPALGAGCATVLRPSEETPLSALAIANIAEIVGLPAGLFNVVPTSRQSADMVGTVLCESPLVKKMSFTGSTAVGKSIYQKSAATVKRISMELGGNAPCIVFNSADAKLAAAKTVQSRFRNTGQTCICAERVFVQEGIYDEYLDELKKAVAELIVGNPLLTSNTVSAVINKRSLDNIESIVADAKEKGATVVTGGKVLQEGTLFYEPTILADCSTDMKCISQEIFGPVVPLIKFNTEEEVVAMANAHASGLAGYFFSRDMSQIWRVTEQLEVGMVGINEQAVSNEMMPFGGVKESGIGREGSVHGMDDYTELKFVAMGI